VRADRFFDFGVTFMHGPGRFRSAVLIVPACAMALAACSDQSPVEGTSPAIWTSNIPSPASATSTPATTAAPRLTVTGFGTLRFGMTQAQAEQALGAPITGEGGTGDEFCTLGHSVATPGLTMAVVAGKVVAAAGDGEAAPSTVVTQEGVRIGMPVGELLPLLPTTVTKRPYTSGPNTTEYDLTVGPGAAESFLVDDTSRRVTSFSYGDPAYVVGTEFLCL
jgi:hypothetical protein